MIYAIALGRLGRDPETKTVNGRTMVKFSIASDRGGDKTDWIHCTAWEKRGEFVAKWFHKGDAILVRGNMTSREHEGKTYWEIDVDKAEFTGGKREAAPVSFPDPAEAADESDALPFDL